MVKDFRQSMREDRPRISPSLIVILFEGFLSRLSFGIISFVLPLYAYRQLGLSLTETGFLFSLNLIAEQAFKPLMGWVADRFGLKLSLTAAIGIRSAVALLLAFAGSPWQVFSIRALHGFSEALRDPSVSALIAEHSGAGRVASSFAWYTTSKMVAGSVGKAVGGFLLVWTGANYRLVFLAAFSLSVLPLYVVARYLRAEEATAHFVARRKPQSGEKSVDLKQASEEGGQAGSPRSIVSVGLLGFLFAITAHMVQPLFPLLATEYAGLSVSQTSLIYAISVALLLFSGPLFGWLSDNVSRKAVLMVRGVANSLSSILYWIFPSFWGFAIGSVADGLGKSAFRPAWGSLMAQFASHDRRRRARTMGYLSLGEGLGETLGPILGGLLWHFWGIPVLLSVRLILALIGEVYALRMSSATGNQDHANDLRPVV